MAAALAAFAVVGVYLAGSRSLVLQRQDEMQAELEELRDRLQEQPIGPTPRPTGSAGSAPSPTIGVGPPAPPAPAASGGAPPSPAPAKLQVPDDRKATKRPLSGFTHSTAHITISEDHMVATHAGGIGRSDPGLADEWGSAVVGDVMWAPATRPQVYFAEFVLRRAPDGAAMIGVVSTSNPDQTVISRGC